VWISPVYFYFKITHANSKLFKNCYYYYLIFSQLFISSFDVSCVHNQKNFYLPKNEYGKRMSILCVPTCFNQACAKVPCFTIIISRMESFKNTSKWTTGILLVDPNPSETQQTISHNGAELLNVILIYFENYANVSE